MVQKHACNILEEKHILFVSASVHRNVSWFCFSCCLNRMLGCLGFVVWLFCIWPCSEWRVQAEVLGAKSQEKPSVHCLQDWKSRGGGRETWRTRWNLRWFHSIAASGRVPLCCVWSGFHHWWKLPEEQDLLHCMVIYQLVNFTSCLGLIINPTYAWSLIDFIFKNDIGHLIHQRWEWRWCMLAPKRESRENWMAFKLNCKQLIQANWALTLLNLELFKQQTHPP